MRLHRLRPLPGLLACVCVAVVFASSAIVPSAQASQYPIDQAKQIIAGEHLPRLRRAGVRNTGDFLVWGRTAEGRKLLADRAGISVDQVTAWVCLSDLMRVPGIGPDVARLFAAVGLRTMQDLQRADADALAATVRDLNKKTHLSTNPPGADSIRYWIGLARDLPLVLLLDDPPRAAEHP